MRREAARGSCKSLILRKNIVGPIAASYRREQPAQGAAPAGVPARAWPCHAAGRPPEPSMLIDFLTSALVTLLVTVDPPGLAPISLGITPGMSGPERNQV